jgi:hypothetical protein
MTRIRRILLALATAGAAATPFAAAVAADPPPPQAGAVAGSAEEAKERAALVEEIVRIVQPLDKQKEWVAYQTGELDGWYEKTLRDAIARRGLTEKLNPKLTPDVIKAAQARYKERIGTRLTKEIDFVQVYKDVYQRAFNEFFTLEELRQVVAFYRTPAGTKFARNMADLMVNVLDTQAAIGDATGQFIEQTIAEEIERLEKSPAPR